MNEARTNDFVTGLQDAVRQNPVSAALIGMGLVWMLTGGSRITAAGALIGPAARATAEGMSQGAMAATNAVSSAADSARSLGARGAERARDAVAQAGNAVGEFASNALNAVKSNAPAASGATVGPDTVLNPVIASLKDTFERQPLLLGAIGIAIGTAIATTLPATRRESEFAGEAADKVKAMASDAFEQVKETSKRVVEAVKDEATAQGLTPDSAKASAVTLGEKVVEVATAVRSPGRTRGSC